MDQGESLGSIERDTKILRETCRRWRDDPTYREATYEYNPEFNYDANDIIDRSVVAHELCCHEPNPDERLELMLAIVGLHYEPEAKSGGWVTASAYSKRNREGAE